MKRAGTALVLALVLVAVVTGACGDSDSEGDGDGGGELVGLFSVEAGACADAGVESGSWFRMVQPGGTVTDGPFVSNGDSECGEKSWTPLGPGEDGGLVTGDFQPHPDPAFGEGGAGLAAAILEPQPWFAVPFAVATNAVDPQTETEVEPPVLRADAGGSISGDLRAWGVGWNQQHFNQGAPKPDGSMPGATSDVTGTIDADTGAYSIEWTSQIVGGPFNNFTGIWHLEGTFEER